MASKPPNTLELAYQLVSWTAFLLIDLMCCYAIYPLSLLDPNALPKRSSNNAPPQYDRALRAVFDFHCIASHPRKSHALLLYLISNGIPPFECRRVRFSKFLHSFVSFTRVDQFVPILSFPSSNVFHISFSHGWGIPGVGKGSVHGQ